MENDINENVGEDNENNSSIDNNQGITENSFSIPEEYQDRAWAKNIKSQEDLFKSYDNAQSLIGKKTIGIPDFDKASDEELASFYEKTAPKNIEDYDLNMPDNDKQFFGELFKENGLNKRQATNIINKYNEYIQEGFSEDGYRQELQERFGNDFENQTKPISDFIRNNLKREDGEILAKMPNKVIGMFMTFANNVKKAYGIENQTAIENNAIDSIQNYTRSDFQNKVIEMTKLDREGKLNGVQKANMIAELNKMKNSINWRS